MLPIKTVTCPSCKHEFVPLVPENASRGGQRWVAKSAQMLVDIYPSDSTVIDFGCGLFRNTPFLASKFKRVIAMDTRKQLDRTRELVGSWEVWRLDRRESEQVADVIFICAVLHILPPCERLAALLNAKRFMKPAGEVFIDVPVHESYYSDASKFTPYCDGFVLESKSFYKVFSCAEVRGVLSAGGLEVLQWWNLKNHAVARCRPERKLLTLP